MVPHSSSVADVRVSDFRFSGLSEPLKCIHDRLLRHYGAFIEKHNKTELNAKLISGSWMHFKGSDKPENLKSDTLTSATLDECGTMHETVWSEVIRPMLG
jgi:hypothetical protein